MVVFYQTVPFFAQPDGKEQRGRRSFDEMSCVPFVLSGDLKYQDLQDLLDKGWSPVRETGMGGASATGGAAVAFSLILPEKERQEATPQEAERGRRSFHEMRCVPFVLPLRWDNASHSQPCWSLLTFVDRPAPMQPAAQPWRRACPCGMVRDRTRAWRPAFV